MVTLCAVLVGLSYFTLALFFFLLNGLLLVTLSRNSEFNTSTYRIIMNLNVTCMMMLFVFMVGGVMTVAQTTFNYYLDKLLGSTIVAAWYAYLGIILTIAIDRLLVFVFQKPDKHSRITIIFLSYSWISGFTIFALSCFPGFGLSYDAGGSYYIWNYGIGYGSDAMAVAEPYYDGTMFGTVFLVYLVVVCYIAKACPHIFTISFLYQITFTCLTFWPPTSLLNEPGTDIVMNFGWLVECGMFASLTALINRRIGKKMMEVIVKNDKLFVSSIRTTMVSSVQTNA
uniref:7TM_GPCR_Srx domain-containing protein n=1 Tax=Steinernema glaseri TaxID=37863 RepID=A0A1I7Z908_9BILA